jgi:pumilio family protein 6
VLACGVQVCGNVMGLANQHSASRVIQWCLKEGSAADKVKLTAEIRANILLLSKSKYGRHVVQKLINVATKEEVPGEGGTRPLFLLMRCRAGCAVLLCSYVWLCFVNVIRGLLPDAVCCGVMVFT